MILDPDGDEVGAFCTLVDPGCDPGPTHVHGISASMLAGAPTFAAIHPYLADQLSGRVVVGHNVDGFDLAFLRAECRRAGGGAWSPGHVPSRRHPGRGPGPPRPAGEGQAGRLLHPLRPDLGRPPQRPRRCPGHRGPVPIDAGRAGRRPPRDHRPAGRRPADRHGRARPAVPPVRSTAAAQSPGRLETGASRPSVPDPTAQSTGPLRPAGTPSMARVRRRPRRIAAVLDPSGVDGPAPAASQHLAGVVDALGAGHQRRPGQDDHTDDEHGQGDDLEGDPPRSGSSWSANRVMPRTMLTSGLMVTMVVLEAVIGPGVQGVLDQEHGAQAGDGQHVGLEVGEHVTPPLFGVRGDGLGQRRAVGGGDRGGRPEGGRPPPPGSVQGRPR